LAAVIGHPVSHSLSPAIHNAAFAASGLDWTFLAFDVAPGGGASAIEAMRSLGLGGLSVTMPHKADVAASVDELAPGAAALGVVNCVQPDGSKLIGHNTDGDGFVSALRRDPGMDVAGSDCLVVGAGGAARAVAEALGRHGAARVGVTNRTRSKAADVAQLAGPVGEIVAADSAHQFELIINATSVGMAGTAESDGLPLSVDRLTDAHTVVDLVYNPIETPLLAAASGAGAQVVDGSGMLVGQAALAFELWTGTPAPVDEMAAAARTAIANLLE
jgi:shikimate dehydrogenase